MKLTQLHSLKVTSPELFAQLVFRVGKYLWKKEQLTAARSFFEFGLQLEISPSTENYAQAYRLLGHITLDMARPKAALSAYHRALRVREALEGPNSPSVADVYDSIACSYTEQGNVDNAFAYLSRAVKIYNMNNSLLMGRTQAIYAMSYLRAGQPRKALAALQHCWKLQNLTEGQVARSKYPEHSGDIVLLSRIKYAQGLKQEAQKLASRAISLRKGLYGDKGPRVADSTFILARMLEAEGKDVRAAELLRSITEMSRGVPEMKGHLARSLWFLAMVEDKMGDSTKAGQLKIEAKKERDKIGGREAADEDTDAAFMNLVPWMLW